MKTGKVSETVFKRSILKYAGKQHENILMGMHVGSDCAVFSFDGNTVTMSVVNQFSETPEELITRLLNKYAAENAKIKAVAINLLLSEDTEESFLKDFTDRVSKALKSCGAAIASVNASVSIDVKETKIVITGIGEADRLKKNKVKAGDDIVITKWIALEATEKIAHIKEAELNQKFPAKYIYDAKNFDKYLSVIPEAATAVKSDVTAMHYLSEGGVFGGLWEFAESEGVGLSIDLKKIPIKQETIEIFNYYDLNPYLALSGGSMILTARDGNALVFKLKEQGINAVCVGKVTASKDRVVISEDFTRFLEPSKEDELYKIPRA
ncbi:MAG: hydrogenase maturation factor [Lachnospiraceae bacterium]|nr:hydrogenase maturation factor [Lachnospiraceae bacterium]